MMTEASLNWIKANRVKQIRIAVSIGNEEVFGFYAKYGFLPTKKNILVNFFVLLYSDCRRELFLHSAFLFIAYNDLGGTHEKSSDINGV